MTDRPVPRPLVAGIDLGGTKILGRVIDPTEPTVVVAVARADTPRGGDAIVESIVAVVEDLVRDVGRGNLAAVGIGAAGLVDLHGVLEFAPNLPNVFGLDLRAVVADRVGLPVVIDN